MELYSSSWIFKLALEHGISLEAGSISPFSDEDFLSFESNYKKLSNQRDIELEKYLANNPTLFRVYLPFREGASLGIASQIVWYLDEAVIRDPIHSVISHFAKNPEETKIELRNVLQRLALFRDLIEANYILLVGPTNMVDVPDEPSELAEHIFRDQEIISEFRNISRWGYSQNENASVISLHLPDTYQLQFTGKTDIPDGGFVSFPAVSMAEGAQKIAFEELANKVDRDPMEMFKDTYLKQLQLPIYAAINAHTADSALMLPKALEINNLILRKVENELSTEKQLASIEALNLVLPFVAGVPPERLLDIREQTPLAFREFRSSLATIILEATKDEVPSQEFLKNRVEKELVPYVNRLDKEMLGTIKNTGIMGIGGPLVAGTGVLAGSIMGAPAHLLIAAGLTGAFAGVKGLADSVSTSNKAKGHPGYFLWKAMKYKR